MSSLKRASIMLCLCLASLLLTSCNWNDFEIVLPIRNAKFIDQLPERVLIRYSVEPELITLNGIPVQHLFTFNEGDATATGDSLAAYFRQGQNNIAVDAHHFGPRRHFYLDTEGPRVIIRSTETDGNVMIQGEFKDPAGTYAATLNGIPVDIDNHNQFTASVAPADIYTFETEDNYAQQATHHFASRETIVEDALKVRIDQQGINAIIPTVQEALEEKDLASLLGSIGANTLLDTNVSITTQSYSITEKLEVCKKICVDFNIFDVCIDTRVVCDLVDKVTSFPALTINILKLKATLSTLNFEELNVHRLQLNSGNGWEGLTLGAVAKNVNLGVSIDADVLGIGEAAEAALRFFGLYNKLSFLAGEFTLNIHLNSIGIEADLGLSADNGEVNISVQDIDEVQVNGITSAFVFDFNIPQAIRDFGFGLGNLVITALENGLNAARTAIMDLVLGKIVPAIANLILDPLINELQVRVGATINNGAYLTAFMGVEELHVVNNKSELLVAIDGRLGTETVNENTGGIDIGLNVGLPNLLGLENDILPNIIGIPSDLGPAPGIVPESLGFYFTPVAVPNPESVGNFSMVVSSNLINQTLFAVYEAGILSPTVNILDQLSEQGYYLLTDPETANTRILLRPTMAPQLSFRGQTQSIAYINVDEFVVTYQRLNEAGEWENSYSVPLNFEIPAQLSSDDSDGLRLGMIYPAIELSYDSQHFVDFRLQLPPRLFVVKGIAALLIDQINRGLGLIKLPSDVLVKVEEESLAINPETVKAVGKPRRHFAFSASLDAL